MEKCDLGHPAANPPFAAVFTSQPPSESLRTFTYLLGLLLSVGYPITLFWRAGTMVGSFMLGAIIGTFDPAASEITFEFSDVTHKSLHPTIVFCVSGLGILASALLYRDWRIASALFALCATVPVALMVWDGVVVNWRFAIGFAAVAFLAFACRNQTSNQQGRALPPTNSPEAPFP